MSAERDETRIVRSWLEDGVTVLPDRALDAVLDQLPTTPQRRTFWSAWAFLFTNKAARLAAAAVVILSLALGMRVLSEPRMGGNADPTPMPSSGPSASPISRPGATWPLDAGTYSLPDFPLGVTFTVPTGWRSCSDSLVEQSVCYTPVDSMLDVRVSFLIVENVVADPCSPNEEPRDPPAGPTVDDLVAAISTLDGFEASAPLDVTVDGYHGKQLTLAAPQNPGCDPKTWLAAERANSVSPGEVNLLHVLDVNGTRLVIAGAYYPQEPATAELRAALDQIIASVQISP